MQTKPSFPRLEATIFLGFCLFLATLHRASPQYIASTSTVCVGVTVYSNSGGSVPIDESCSSGSSSSSGGGEAGGVGESEDGATTTDQVIFGARRHTEEVSRSRTLRLLRQWYGNRGGGGHAAAPAVPRTDALRTAPVACSPKSTTPFSDVPADAWFAPAVNALLRDGLLSDEADKFFPHRSAVRAEMVKLLLLLEDPCVRLPAARGGVFTDVPATAWFAPYMETGARKAIVKGDGNCHGRPACTARPESPLTRADAAAFIVRTMSLTPTGDAPSFSDVSADAWYAPYIRTAADHCILQGDDIAATVRPEDAVSRAEMASMIHRARQHLRYGIDCRHDLRGAPQTTRETGMILQPIASGDVCSEPSVSCLADALKQDAVIAASTLAAALVFPDIRTLRTSPLTETGLWVAFGALLYLLSRSVISLKHR